MTKLPVPERVLEQHIIALGKTGAGKSSKMRVLIEHLLRKRERVTIIDIKGDWWGLKASADGKSDGFPIVIFGGKHADVPLMPGSGRAVAELLNTAAFPCLIDLRGWRPGDRAKWYIDFMDATFEKTEGKRYIMISEVHNFAPKGKVLSPQAGEMLHWSNRLASEGRGYGITFLADSQRPQKVHNDLLTSVETLIACKVIHKADREAIEDWIDGCADPELGKQVIRELASMKKPDSWVWSPEIEFGPKRVEWPLFETFDSFKPQEAASTGRLKGWAEIDLQEVKTKLATVVAEAQANDPALLRKQIAELQKQLKAKDGSASAAEIVEARRTGERDGFDKGATHGYRSGWDEHAKAVHAALASLPAAPPVLGARPENPVRRVETHRPAVASQGSRIGTTLTVPRARQIDGRAPTNGSGAAATDVGSGGKHRILVALAQQGKPIDQRRLSLLTGLSSRSGTWSTYLSSLRQAGYIEGREALSITDAGLSALGSFVPLPTGQDLIEYWRLRLGDSGKRAIFDAVLEAYPSSIDQESAASAANLSARSGTWSTYLSELRGLGLIEGRGQLCASEDLFA